MSEEDCNRSTSGDAHANAIDRYVGGRMRKLRCKRKLQAAELAAELGITSDELSLIENGRARAGVDVLSRASKALHVEVSYFFEDLKLQDPAAKSSRGAHPASKVVPLSARRKRPSRIPD